VKIDDFDNDLTAPLATLLGRQHAGAAPDVTTAARVDFKAVQDKSFTLLIAATSGCQKAASSKISLASRPIRSLTSLPFLGTRGLGAGESLARSREHTPPTRHDCRPRSPTTSTRQQYAPCPPVRDRSHLALMAMVARASAGPITTAFGYWSRPSGFHQQLAVPILLPVTRGLSRPDFPCFAGPIGRGLVPAEYAATCRHTAPVAI